MSGDLLLPGRRRGKEVLTAAAIDNLHELYLEYHHTACSPFKMLRLDRYFLQIEHVMAVCMRRTRGGREHDNRWTPKWRPK